MTQCKYQSEIDEIITRSNSRKLVETANNIANEMIFKNERGNLNESRSVSTSQIRNIFGTTKKIEMNLSKDKVKQEYSKLLLLKPKMAYANGRHNNKDNSKIPGFKILVDCLSYAIDKAEEDYDRMKNFFNFFEAVLAYHKAEGGK